MTYLSDFLDYLMKDTLKNDNIVDIPKDLSIIDKYFFLCNYQTLIPEDPLEVRRTIDTWFVETDKITTPVDEPFPNLLLSYVKEHSTFPRDDGLDVDDYTSRMIRHELKKNWLTQKIYDESLEFQGEVHKELDSVIKNLGGKVRSNIINNCPK